MPGIRGALEIVNQGDSWCSFDLSYKFIELANKECLNEKISRSVRRNPACHVVRDAGN